MIVPDQKIKIKLCFKIFEFLKICCFNHQELAVAVGRKGDRWGAC